MTSPLSATAPLENRILVFHNHIFDCIEEMPCPTMDFAHRVANLLTLPEYEVWHILPPGRGRVRIAHIIFECCSV